MTALWFSDIDRNRRRTVTDDAGRPVAVVHLGSRRRYEAHAADGRLVCRGRGRTFRRRYDVVDAAGHPLASVRTSLFSERRRTVRLADGRVLRARDVVWPRHLQIAADDGAVLMTVERSDKRWAGTAVVARPSAPGWTLELTLGVILAGWGESARPKLADGW